MSIRAKLKHGNYLHVNELLKILIIASLTLLILHDISLSTFEKYQKYLYSFQFTLNSIFFVICVVAEHVTHILEFHMLSFFQIIFINLNYLFCLQSKILQWNNMKFYSICLLNICVLYTYLSVILHKFRYNTANYDDFKCNIDSYEVSAYHMNSYGENAYSMDSESTWVIFSKSKSNIKKKYAIFMLVFLDCFYNINLYILLLSKPKFNPLYFSFSYVMFFISVILLQCISHLLLIISINKNSKYHTSYSLVLEVIGKIMIIYFGHLVKLPYKIWQIKYWSVGWFIVIIYLFTILIKILLFQNSILLIIFQNKKSTKNMATSHYTELIQYSDTESLEEKPESIAAMKGIDPYGIKRKIQLFFEKLNTNANCIENIKNNYLSLGNDCELQLSQYDKYSTIMQNQEHNILSLFEFCKNSEKVLKNIDKFLHHQNLYDDLVYQYEKDCIFIGCTHNNLQKLKTTYDQITKTEKYFYKYYSPIQLMNQLDIMKCFYIKSLCDCMCNNLTNYFINIDICNVKDIFDRFENQSKKLIKIYENQSFDVSTIHNILTSITTINFIKNKTDFIDTLKYFDSVEHLKTKFMESYTSCRINYIKRDVKIITDKIQGIQNHIYSNKIYETNITDSHKLAELYGCLMKFVLFYMLSEEATFHGLFHQETEQNCLNMLHDEIYILLQHQLKEHIRLSEVFGKKENNRYSIIRLNLKIQIMSVLYSYHKLFVYFINKSNLNYHNYLLTWFESKIYEDIEYIVMNIKCLAINHLQSQWHFIWMSTEIVLDLINLFIDNSNIVGMCLLKQSILKNKIKKISYTYDGSSWSRFFTLCLKSIIKEYATSLEFCFRNILMKTEIELYKVVNFEHIHQSINDEHFKIYPEVHAYINSYIELSYKDLSLCIYDGFRTSFENAYNQIFHLDFIKLQDDKAKIPKTLQKVFTSFTDDFNNTFENLLLSLEKLKNCDACTRKNLYEYVKDSLIPPYSKIIDLYGFAIFRSCNNFSIKYTIFCIYNKLQMALQL